MTLFYQNIKRQQEADSIFDHQWDVVIVGAGPAGATAAAYLTANHHQVLLLDRKKFPREKICGDGLLPDAMRCLDSTGIGESVRAMAHCLHKLAIFNPSQNEFEVPVKCLTIKRSLLDMMVAQRAAESGAVFACGEVEQLLNEPDGLVSFTIRGSVKSIRARIGIVATGSDIRLLRKINWPAKKKPSAVGFRCYVRSSLAIDRLVFSFDKSIVPGYAWIFPLGNHEYNIGCGMPLRRDFKRNINFKRIFKNFIDGFPLARELMRTSKRTTPLRGASLRWDFEGAYPFVRGPIVAIGETIGTTLPFSGEGIGKAMESGQRAAEAIHAALGSGDLTRLWQYSRQMESELMPRYRSYRIAEKWLANAWVNDFILNRFRKSRYAKEILAGIVAETSDPQEIFSLKGIFKTFWK
jgi:geranylgeranyl reductase family protein